MILHLISDDKFADYAINQFKEGDNSSCFVLVKDFREQIITYISQIEKVVQLVYDSKEYLDLIDNLDRYNGLILHGFFKKWQEQIVISAPLNLKIGWVFWGGEIYGRKDLRMKFLSLKSRILYSSRTIVKCIELQRNSVDQYLPDNEVFQRINYCLTDVHEDFEFVRNYLKSEMQELWYNYYSIEETLGSLMQSTINGSNIFVGNSSTLENNHIDAFFRLKKMRLNGKKVIVPLSYGEIWLRRMVVRLGNLFFKSSFQPLTSFVERETYNVVLQSCSIVVMNHFRQQAMGNIITSLWLGAKVYMSNNSLLFSYFKRLNVVIFSIEDDLNPSNLTALISLSDEEREHNRKILMQEYGQENMKSRIQLIVNTLNN